jgi:prepilin-type N-terminal cleavage/methylation domain-containing protein
MVRRRSTTAGFTLVEMMIVVIIVGVMATLATYAVRKYIFASKTSEAVSMMSSIKSAEEAFRDETFVYLDVSGSYTSLYPMTTPGTFKVQWGDTSTTVGQNWRTLGVMADAPVQFGYAVVARPAGTAVPSPPTTKNFTFPSTDPSYCVLAQGDVDGDGNPSYVVSHSLNAEIYIENEGE